MTNIDDVAQTLAEYERLAITSGAKVQIDPPEFSDGLSLTPWTPFWIGAQPPKVARATVYRDDVPTVVYVVWDESLPVETAQTEDGRLWRDLWIAQPTKRFGSFALRTALRRAFREVVGDRVEPDEDAPRVAAPTPDPRNWDDEILLAQSLAELDATWADMRAHRARTGALEVAYRKRRDELTAAVWIAPTPELSDDERARHRAFFGAERPEVQDHRPPQNRAARRASARKKGGRR